MHVSLWSTIVVWTSLQIRFWCTVDRINSQGDVLTIEAKAAVPNRSARQCETAQWRQTILAGVCTLIHFRWGNINELSWCITVGMTSSVCCNAVMGLQQKVFRLFQGVSHILTNHWLWSVPANQNWVSVHLELVLVRSLVELKRQPDRSCQAPYDIVFWMCFKMRLKWARAARIKWAWAIVFLHSKNFHHTQWIRLRLHYCRMYCRRHSESNFN